MYRFLPKGMLECQMTKQDSRFWMADLHEIRLLIYCILSLKLSNDRNERNEQLPSPFTLCVDRNLQRHRAVSLRQRGFFI